MRKNLMFAGAFAVTLMLTACGSGVQRKTSEKYSAAEVEQADKVIKYYNASLALLKNLVVEKDVNSVLGYMEQNGDAPILTAVVPPAFSQKDSASVVNPGTYFNEETRRNLKQSFMQLFQVRKQFYANFNRYLSSLKAKDKSAADKLLPVNYRLSVEMAEYKENILDMLSPFTEEAQKVLLNDNSMKDTCHEQDVYHDAEYSAIVYAQTLSRYGPAGYENDEVGYSVGHCRTFADGGRTSSRDEEFPRLSGSCRGIHEGSTAYQVPGKLYGRRDGDLRYVWTEPELRLSHF